MANALLAEMESELERTMNMVDETLATLERQLEPLARQKVGLLKQKLGYLDEILKQRERVIGDLQALKDLYPALEITNPQGTASQNAKPQRTGEYSNMKVWEAAREVLRKSGHPMYTRPIAEEVVAGGRQIAEPISSKLNSNMRQKPSVFVSEERKRKRIWRLKEWDEENRG